LKPKTEASLNLDLKKNVSEVSTKESVTGRTSTATSGGCPSPQKKAKKNPLLNYVELDTLGCGSFGRVVKVQKKTSGEQYAMKVIEKKKMEDVSPFPALSSFNSIPSLSHSNLI
jgi:serine/threonine protein kinase